MSMALAIWIGLQALTVFGVLNYWRHLPRDRQEESPAGVAVILSVRDDWDGGPSLIDRIKAQSAPARLVITTSGACLAAEILAANYPDWVQLVRAGIAADEGQKIHKIRAALRELRNDDQYLIFIDADIEPPARMFGRLLFPLVRGKADISTGYRILLPHQNAASTLVGAVEMQLATLPRLASRTMPWGGAMAMRRDLVDSLHLEQAMAGRLSDDLSIGLIGWHAKLRLRPVRDLLVPCHLEASDPVDFAVRQYRHIATNSIGMWVSAMTVVGLQSVGWLWALVWGGWPAIAVGYVCAWMRLLVRRRILTSVLEPEQCSIARRSLQWDGFAPFIVTFAHLTAQLLAVTSNSIRWGGWEYELKNGQVVRMSKITSVD